VTEEILNADLWCIYQIPVRRYPEFFSTSGKNVFKNLDEKTGFDRKLTGTWGLTMESED